MKLSLFPYRLNFKYPFKISHGTRTGTDAVYVRVENENNTGWGEATLPPYLPETQQTVIEFCESFYQRMQNRPMNEWIAALNEEQFNMSAKAALDMALWNLRAAIKSTTIRKTLGIEPNPLPLATYTLGVSGSHEMKIKIAEADAIGFQLFKIKLNGIDDKHMIEQFRQLSNKPFAVDVNQGWKTVEEAVTKIEWLKSSGCLLVEQPLLKNNLEEMKFLKANASLPLYADESCQRLNDIELLKNCFDGINVKLMKCGGLTEAYQMILKAKQLGLKVLIGCMSESSVGCTTAAQLAPLADYTDLDGPYLISNDPFTGMKIENGCIVASSLKQITDFKH